MQDAFETNRVLVKSQIKYTLAFQGLHPTVVGDPFRLGQVLTNVLANAAKFTDHGEIEVVVKNVKKPNGKIASTFSVKDTGIGMDAETIARLFHPFMQADSSPTRRYGGTGLGLLITKRLVEGMGGKLEVQSRPGQGTTFSWCGFLPSASFPPRVCRRRFPPSQDDRFRSSQVRPPSLWPNRRNSQPLAPARL